MSFKPGQFICNGKYEILALEGEGSFARVWKAREPGFADRLVAIKELKREELTTEVVRKSELRFELEKQIARAMGDHGVPFVVHTHTVDRLPESGQPLLVMEYMPGGSLEKRIRDQSGGLPVLEALEIVLTLCAALQAFHGLPGLQPVHRDIKPSNILFSGGGEARLADFGVAQVHGSSVIGSRTLGTADLHPGTPEYMAPEQEETRGYLRPAADIFALGCVLFEMLTGQLYKRQRTGAPPGAFRSGLPRQLDAALARALAQRPDDRYESAEAFAEALRSLRDELVAKQKRGEQISNLRRRANSALERRDLVTAWQAVSAWLALSPDDAEALGLRARIDAAEREAALAAEIAGYRRSFEAALQGEKLSTARNALASWERAATRDPETGAARRRLAQAEAAAALRARVVPLRQRAQAALSADNWKPALRAAQEWQRLEPDDPAALATLTAAEQLRPASGGSRLWLWLLGGPGALLLLALVVWGLSALFGGPDDGGVPVGEEGETTQTSPAVLTTTPTLSDTPNPDTPPAGAAAGDTWTRPADGMTMVYAPAGSFLMGSAEDDSGADSDEFPQREVTLDGFWIDRTEVTNAQYGRCVIVGDCEVSSLADNETYNGADYPVVGVSWYDAEAYCEWAGGRLLTEAEWEYAARGPNARRYPWGNEAPTCDLAMFGGCEGGIIPVGTLTGGASWVGALDIAGNVWEWVQDWYASAYSDNSPAINPAGPSNGSSKVLRGGSWDGPSRLVRSANRSNDQPQNRYVSFGFRCALPQAVDSQ